MVIIIMLITLETNLRMYLKYIYGNIGYVPIEICAKN